MALGFLRLGNTHPFGHDGQLVERVLMLRIVRKEYVNSERRMADTCKIACPYRSTSFASTLERKGNVWNTVAHPRRYCYSTRTSRVKSAVRSARVSRVEVGNTSNRVWSFPPNQIFEFETNGTSRKKNVFVLRARKFSWGDVIEGE